MKTVEKDNCRINESLGFTCKIDLQSILIKYFNLNVTVVTLKKNFFKNQTELLLKTSRMLFEMGMKIQKKKILYACQNCEFFGLNKFRSFSSMEEVEIFFPARIYLTGVIYKRAELLRPKITLKLLDQLKQKFRKKDQDVT